MLNNAVREVEQWNGKLQRSIYSIVRPRLHESDLQWNLSRRCCKYFPTQFNYPDFEFSSAFALASNFGSQVALSLLKMFPGAWLTHRSSQAEPRLCIFCKRGPDSLRHLLHCNLRWTQVSRILLPFLPFVDDPPALLALARVWYQFANCMSV